MLYLNVYVKKMGTSQVGATIKGRKAQGFKNIPMKTFGARNTLQKVGVLRAETNATAFLILGLSETQIISAITSQIRIIFFKNHGEYIEKT